MILSEYNYSGREGFRLGESTYYKGPTVGYLRSIYSEYWAYLSPDKQFHHFSKSIYILNSSVFKFTDNVLSFNQELLCSFKD
jgi:hypothetical protein